MHAIPFSHCNMGNILPPASLKGNAARLNRLGATWLKYGEQRSVGDSQYFCTFFPKVTETPLVRPTIPALDRVTVQNTYRLYFDHCTRPHIQEATAHQPLRSNCKPASMSAETPYFAGPPSDIWANDCSVLPTQRPTPSPSTAPSSARVPGFSFDTNAYVRQPHLSPCPNQTSAPEQVGVEKSWTSHHFSDLQ